MMRFEKSVKYTAIFVVQKSFEVQVSFEAPNDQIAELMADDMIQDEDFDFGDGEEIGIESVVFYSMADGDKDARVDRSVKSWCESWWKDREEEAE